MPPRQIRNFNIKSQTTLLAILTLIEQVIWLSHTTQFKSYNNIKDDEEEKHRFV